jgi:hypothetical protein
MPSFVIMVKCFVTLGTQKYGQHYIGIVEGNSIDHPDLLIEKRARMKILLLNPQKDLPLKKITAILKEVLTLYK